MRVLHVIGAMDRGGAETLLMNLYRAVDRDGLQFDFLVHEDRECDYDQEILSLGGRMYRLPRFTGPNVLAYSRACERFFASHAEHCVVHGHIGSSAALYLTAAKRHGRFTIAHSHARNYLRGLQNIEFKALSYPTRFIADRFFACSLEAGLDRFGRNVVDGPRFSVLDNGIDLEKYRCDEASRNLSRHRFGVEGVPVFGHVGRFSEEKNHRFLIEVFVRVKRLLPDAVLMLAGRGPLEDDVRMMVRREGLESSVRFLGVCDDVPDLLRALDVFVFPSVNEGLAIAAVEAQASGLPTLMSTGVPERTVASHHARRLPLDGGEEAWAKACVDAYSETRTKPREDAISEVRASGFDINDVAEKLTAFYASVHNDRQPRMGRTK